MLYSLPLSVSLITLLAVAEAAVLPKNARNSTPRRLSRRSQETDVNKCRPVGAGQCTLTVIASMVSVPTDKDNPFAGTADNRGILVMDKDCYNFGLDGSTVDDPDGDWTGPIKVDGFSEPIQFTADYISPADIHGISFSYKGKEFSDCYCEDDGSGLQGAMACRCPFDCGVDTINDAGFASGTCGVHVTQYQKPDPATDNYKLDITLYDNNGDNVGGNTNIDAPTGKTYGLTSKLPYVFEATAGGEDDDPLTFAYAGYKWNSDDGCSEGAFDSGNRDMDCTFSCSDPPLGKAAAKTLGKVMKKLTKGFPFNFPLSLAGSRPTADHGAVKGKLKSGEGNQNGNGNGKTSGHAGKGKSAGHFGKNGTSSEHHETAHSGKGQGNQQHPTEHHDTNSQPQDKGKSGDKAKHLGHGKLQGNDQPDGPKDSHTGEASKGHEAEGQQREKHGDDDAVKQQKQKQAHDAKGQGKRKESGDSREHLGRSQNPELVSLE